MPQIINYLPTTDALSTPGTLQLNPASNVSYISFNVLVQPALVQFWKPVPGQTGKFTLDEIVRKYAAGTIGVVARNVAGAQFASAVAGNPATIYAEMAFNTDVQVEGGTVTGAQINSGGQVVPSGLTISGIIDSSGAILAGSGFSVSVVGTGEYNIVFGTAFTARPAVVVTQIAITGAAVTNVPSTVGVLVNTFAGSSPNASSFSFVATVNS